MQAQQAYRKRGQNFNLATRTQPLSIARDSCQKASRYHQIPIKTLMEAWGFQAVLMPPGQRCSFNSALGLSRLAHFLCACHNFSRECMLLNARVLVCPPLLVQVNSSSCDEQTQHSPTLQPQQRAGHPGCPPLCPVRGNILSIILPRQRPFPSRRGVDLFSWLGRCRKHHCQRSKEQQRHCGRAVPSNACTVITSLACDALIRYSRVLLAWEWLGRAVARITVRHLNRAARAWRC